MISNNSIPMSSPDLTQSELDAVNAVLQTPVLSIGPQIDAFERATAQFVGARHAVGVNSGTSGLHLALIAAGVQDGDYVITTPFSFIASANVILYERAIPIFVDVDPRTGNINPALVAECAHDLDRRPPTADRWLPPKIRGQGSGVREYKAGSNSLTPDPCTLSAILPVHAFGQPADLDSLFAIAREHNLAIVEDACEALGAEYKGRRVGSLSPVDCRLATVFAFYPNKQMTTGEGGMIVTQRDDWDAIFRSLRNQGRDVFDAWLNHTRLGYNYRLDEMSAALGAVQMQRIEELLTKRARVAQWYNTRLANIELIETPYLAPTTTRMSWFVYVIRIKPPANRDEVMRQLADVGIPSRPYFTPIHLQPFYREKFGYQRGDFPVTEYLGDVSLALPFSGVMTEEQVAFVCQNLKRIIER